MTKIVVSDDQTPLRIDAYLAAEQSQLSRSSWRKLIDSGNVMVNEQLIKAKYEIQAGDVITFSIPKKQESAPEISIIYEDEDVLVIDKPAGVLVHSKGGLHTEQTVVDVFRDKLPSDDTNRPGVVHRLDRDTSGVMILAKNNDTKTYLQKQFQNRTVQKEYVAVCEGVFKDNDFLIDAAIRRSIKNPGRFVVDPNGKPAQTTVRVMQTRNGKTLVRLLPKTGRTHQLRVHLKHLHAPIVGDRLYGKESDRLLLHAHKLSIAIHHGDHRTFESKIPESFTI
ncbi:TPA: RluA family pseudouridine synthase [Candidatus Saccharibacteria bacterium]|nr:RluA family pseudouridine synthase [Candidatus Saccharibacteria bacterium]HIO87368.1 RluA family pseudouridine synthase [Candidatus Saccharibacteria bacterium]